MRGAERRSSLPGIKSPEIRISQEEAIELFETKMDDYLDSFSDLVEGRKAINGMSLYNLAEKQLSLGKIFAHMAARPDVRSICVYLQKMFKENITRQDLKATALHYQQNGEALQRLVAPRPIAAGEREKIFAMATASFADDFAHVQQCLGASYDGSELVKKRLAEKQGKPLDEVRQEWFLRLEGNSKAIMAVDLISRENLK